ncbi:MAG TPA: hypothetical protein VMF57_16515 [Solirubrobacteraceae bacterium]|nr:hypothetical protein [Solirubrobacteraceae bacterium]
MATTRGPAVTFSRSNLTVAWQPSYASLLEPPPDGRVLVCCSRPTSEVTLDL